MEQKHEEQEQDDMEMRNIIEEARVVLPGVQALFGFQTIAVFNNRFAELADYAKACHALGMIMVVISIAMVMTPAIYYRTCHGQATASMAKLSSRMIRGALGPLAAGLALDMFTVIHVVASGMEACMALSVGAGLGTLALLAGFWFFLPATGAGSLPGVSKLGKTALCDLSNRWGFSGAHNASGHRECDSIEL